MSDDEYYSDNSENESNQSDEELDIKTPKKEVTFKPSKTIETFDDDSEEDDDEEVVEDEIETGFDDEDEIQKGGDEIEYESEEDIDDSESEFDEDEIQKGGDEVEDKIKKQTKTKKQNKSNSKKPGFIIENNDEDFDDDDDEYDENYLQKFDNEITKNYINEFHPECLIHNYDEIAKLSIVVRNSDNIIIDPNHKTIPYLTKYERARILGQRAKQIEAGAKPFINVPENVIDGYIIAELELREKKIPFIIKRPIPGGGCEYWSIKDLENIGF
jgi:DNA-directed RNA polymerase I, II, and III subunit RPABC2